MDLLFTESPDNITLANDSLISPGASNQTDHDPLKFFSGAGAKVLGSFAIILAIAGTTGNSLTILALSKNRKLRSQCASWLIISLSASDLIMCCYHLPSTAYHQLKRNHDGEEMYCRIVTYFFYANGFSSLMSNAAIAINRYVLIVHHEWYGRIFSQMATRIIILFIWLFPLLLLLLPVLEIWGRIGIDNQKQHVCKMLKKNGTSPHLLFVALMVALPLCVMIYSYSRILIQLRLNGLKLQSRGSKRLRQPTKPGFRLKREEMQLTKTLLCIFLCFLVCFIPVALADVLDLQKTVPVFYIVACILFWSSFSINFFIYAVCNRQYRRAYIDLLGLRNIEMVTSIVTEPTTQPTRSRGYSMQPEKVSMPE